MPNSTLVTRATSITVTDTKGVLMTPIAVNDDGLYVREVRIMGTDLVDGVENTVEVLVVRLEAAERGAIEFAAPAQQF
jgi:hypothetical protein